MAAHTKNPKSEGRESEQTRKLDERIKLPIDTKTIENTGGGGDKRKGHRARWYVFGQYPFYSLLLRYTCVEFERQRNSKAQRRRKNKTYHILLVESSLLLQNKLVGIPARPNVDARHEGVIVLYPFLVSRPVVRLDRIRGHVSDFLRSFRNRIGTDREKD